MFFFVSIEFREWLQYILIRPLSLYKDGNMVNLLIGANAPKLMKLITTEVEQYDKFKKGEIQREFVSFIL